MPEGYKGMGRSIDRSTYTLIQLTPLFGPTALAGRDHGRSAQAERSNDHIGERVTGVSLSMLAPLADSVADRSVSVYQSLWCGRGNINRSQVGSNQLSMRRGPQVRERGLFDGANGI